MNHNVFCIAQADNGDGTVKAFTDASGNTDTVTVDIDFPAAVVETISGPMGLTFSSPPELATNLGPGDTITVVGGLGEIPDWQIGMFFVVSRDGRAYYPNAGHLAVEFSKVQP